MTSAADGSPLDLIESAWYERAVGTPELVQALGHSASDERIKWGRPEHVFGTRPEEVAASEHPYITYFGTPGRDVVKGVARGVRIQVDIWTWADRGGIDKLGEIDGILYDRFYDERWNWDGRRFDCGSTSWRAEPPRQTNVLHRVREFGIAVNDKVRYPGR